MQYYNPQFVSYSHNEETGKNIFEYDSLSDLDEYPISFKISVWDNKYKDFVSSVKNELELDIRPEMSKIEISFENYEGSHTQSYSFLNQTVVDDLCYVDDGGYEGGLTHYTDVSFKNFVYFIMKQKEVESFKVMDDIEDYYYCISPLSNRHLSSSELKTLFTKCNSVVSPKHKIIMDDR